MKKCICLMIGLASLFVMSCSKKNEEKINEELKIENVSVSAEFNVVEEEKEIRYVNSLEGLRVRNKPDINAEKVGSLTNKEKVEVISHNMQKVEIDGILSEWIEVKSETGLQGYVFGGYLENSLDDVELIQFLEGEFTETGFSEKYNVVIKYLGNSILKITPNIDWFHEEKELSLKETDPRGCILGAGGDRGGASYMHRMLLDNGKLIIKIDDEVIYNYSEENPEQGELVETHKIIELKKVKTDAL